MTKSAAAVKSTPTPRNGMGGKSTSRTTKAKATVRPIGERIAETLTKFGGAADALTTMARVADEYANATSGVTEWAALATEWTGTARAFAEVAKGDPNTLGRLRGVAALLKSSKAGKGTRAMTPAEAVKVANVKGVAAVKAACEAMDKGGDPFGLRGSTAGTHKPSAGKGSRNAKAPVVSVNPETLAEILTLAVKVAPQISKHETAVEIARLATTLAGIATARAATLATKPVAKRGKSTTRLAG